jgi:D-aminopeptidase
VKIADVRMLAPDQITPLFQAAAEATEEAILNALVAADSMTGFKGHAAHALPHDRLRAAMRKYGRLT